MLGVQIVYQANFRMPSPVSQAAMQQSINRFVGTSSRVEEDTPTQGHLFPRFAVSALPVERGGLGLILPQGFVNLLYSGQLIA